MPSLIEEFLTTGVFAFIILFVRLGTALMIMPGLGDSFVPERIRLHMALGLSLAMSPILAPYIPYPLPGITALAVLVFMEFIVGLFFGTIARIFMTALDTAGMVISISSGLGNAQVFNPAFATQGSLMGAFLSITGVVVLFSVNLHHLLIAGITESYELFPIGGIPDTGSMAEFMARTVSASFLIGVKIASPFIVLTLLVYMGMGVLSRLMPQVQVFLLAIPVQILISITIMMMILSAVFLFWLGEFERGIVFFLSQTG